MPAKVVLTVVRGKLKGKQFIFRGRTHCVLGRSECCHPRLPDDPEHRDVSRTHCLLDLNPPHVSLRDLGSRNGTYINGELIGRRDPSSPTAVDDSSSVERDVKPGDMIQVGNTVFHVDVSMPDAPQEKPSHVEKQEFRTAG